MALHHREIEDLLNKLANGTISDQERLTLARLASGDPFLQDAIEGYETLDRDQSFHLAELKHRVRQKTGKHLLPKKAHFWRIAASVLFLITTLGLMFFGSQREFTGDHSHPIATIQTAPELAEDAIGDDTGSRDARDLATLDKEQSTSENRFLAESPGDQEETKNPEVQNTDTGESATGLDESHLSAARLTEKAESTAGAASTAEPSRQEIRTQIAGRVFDDAGNPLIGANVRPLKSDEVVTTDLEGRFMIDSNVLDNGLEISYAGYETRQIRSEAVEVMDSIALDQDQPAMDEIVLHNFKKEIASRPEAARSGKDQSSKIKSTASYGPLVGWSKYLAYIEQNRKLPEAARKAGISGTVELSFYIDQHGLPQDIRILQSLGYGCDTEAIRLLRQGPRWHTLNSPTDSIALSIVFK